MHVLEDMAMGPEDTAVVVDIACLVDLAWAVAEDLAVPLGLGSFGDLTVIPPGQIRTSNSRMRNM